ncbi:MAG: asparaginase domain-containing protein [Candidatus Melainabacteria bacterium]
MTIETSGPPRRKPWCISTGGTVDLKKSIGDYPGMIHTADDMLSKVADSKLPHRPAVIFDTMIDSSNMERVEQAQITQAMAGLALDDDVMQTGVVMTQGTDTMEENAGLLSYQGLPFPVVLTGSFAGDEDAESDARQNTYRAKLLASYLDVPGVFVVIGDQIHLGTRLKKINTVPWRAGPETPYPSARIPGDPKGRSSYFASVNDQPFGYFDDQNNIHLDAAQLADWKEIIARRQAGDAQALQPSGGFTPAYVEHVLISGRAPAKVFDDLVERLRHKEKPCGAVIEGSLSHHPEFERFAKTIQGLTDEQIYIVTTTTDAQDSLGDHQQMTLPPQQLRMKLAAMLGRHQASDVPGEDFDLSTLGHDLAGEVVGPDVSASTHLKVPRAFFKHGEVIVTTPSLSAAEMEDAVKRMQARKNTSGKQPVLLILGYGDGHVPIGTESMKERLLNGGGIATQPRLNALVSRLESQAEKSGTQPDYSLRNVHRQLTRLCHEDPEEAEEILQQILKHSNEILDVLGRAADEDVYMLVGSKIPEVKPNYKVYEVWPILEFMGANQLSLSLREYFEQLEADELETMPVSNN